MLRSDLCNYSDECIVVKGEITVKGTDNANKRNKKIIFKNNAPFRSCTSKINNAFVDNAEDFDLVIPMYNLLEYSNNNFMTSASLCNYYRDEVNDATNEIVANYRINNNKTTASKSFECKKKILGSTPANTSRLDAEVVVPLKYFSNFWRSLNLPLINCELDLDLTWSKKSVISEILRTPQVGGDNLVDETRTTGATFKINSTNLYVPVVGLSLNDNIRFLENIKQRFKKIISWINIDLK